MSYKLKKLSDNDKKILDTIFIELEKIHIPTSYRSNPKGSRNHCRRTGTNHQKGAKQDVFGNVYYQGKIVKSKITQKYPHIFPLFNNFMLSHNPEFKFSAVYVNKNTICKRHKDSNNAGVSIIIGLGKYTYGRTILHFENKKDIKIHIKNQSLMFNGSEIEYSSEEFKGTRYSLVFFGRKN